MQSKTDGIIGGIWTFTDLGITIPGSLHLFVRVGELIDVGTLAPFAFIVPHQSNLSSLSQCRFLSWALTVGLRVC